MPDEKCHSLLNGIPFIGLAVARAKDMQTPLSTRLFETVVMSAVAGGFATYVGVKLLEQDILTIKNSMYEIKQSVDKFDQKLEENTTKLDQKLEQVRRDVYVPRGVGT